MADAQALAEAIPGGEPALERARARAQQAAEIITEAVAIDPTLLDYDRSRDLDVCTEILRQLRPLARQAALTLQHARLTEAGASRQEFARIGKVNPLAPDELDALSERVVEVAKRVAAAALPDWNTPQRIRERSERLLPDADFLTRFADQLAEAVRPAAELPHPAAAAVQLAALARQLRALADSRP
ncbi:MULTISPECIES: hypothetical protein [unclassified Amycolatopsis]|uniref:hypothetical protein n=1 Tax=unclassified Amycolatopsis TaxID=2618356 RepID=UPI00287536E7|nr:MULTISPECIES: hypothetical protein [unclassified Amycolatopsis]MDS0140542.1 hypothetical protein [Amycolatopsis sp. 505]MDS0149192.1 hypothetical protein [Amycolatopsis sp. CM201R]